MYYPDEEERAAFERYLERNGIEDNREIQEAWRDFCDELEDRNFKSGRQWQCEENINGQDMGGKS